MSERFTEQNFEQERIAGLAALIEQYLPDDKEFIAEMDFEDALVFVYGQLEDIGIDADVVIYEFGVTEKSDEI